MKIRTDFVTNSSSSSFVAFRIESRDLAEHIKKLVGDEKARTKLSDTELAGYGNCDRLNIYDDHVEIYAEVLDFITKGMDLHCFCYIEGNETGRGTYTDSKQMSDSRKVNTPAMITNILVSFFDVKDSAKSKMKKIIVENGAVVTSLVQNDYTDSYSFPSFGSNSCTMIYNDGTVKEKEPDKIDTGAEYTLPLRDGEMYIPKDVSLDNTTCVIIPAEANGFNWLFPKCYNVKKVIVAEGMEVLGSYFENFPFVEEIILPNSITGIKKEYGLHYAPFKGLSKLKKLIWPSGLNEIPDYTFYGCTSLESIVIGSNVNDMGLYAIQNCPALEHIEISPENTYLRIYDDMLFSKYEDEKTGDVFGSGPFWCKPNKCGTAEIPEYVTKILNNFSSGITELKLLKQTESLFMENDYLISGSKWEYTSRIIGLGNVDGNVLQLSFAKDKAVINISDNIGIIGAGAFADHTNLEEITISDSVVIVGKNAFKGCTALKKITFGKNVKILERGAFEGCKALEHIEFSENIKSVRRGVFSGCTNLKTVKLNKNLTELYGADIFDGCRKLETFEFSDKIKSVDQALFVNCTSLKTVKFGKKISKIEFNAFMNSGITEMIFPESMKTLEASCFEHCKNLEKVVMSSGIKKIPPCAFKDCTSLRIVELSPNTTEIAGHAFENCTSLEKIVIPASVKNIKEAAFCGCTALTDIVIEGEPKIGRDVFFGCGAKPVKKDEAAAPVSSEPSVSSASSEPSDKLSGKKFVITGTLSTMSRSEAESLIIKNGGTVSGSVSKNTDVLIAGEKAGSKLAKAESLGVEIWSEEEFMEKIK